MSSLVSTSSSFGANLACTARAVLALTAHIKSCHDIIPDDVAYKKTPEEVCAEYSLKKYIEYLACGFRLEKCRKLAKRVMSILNPNDMYLADVVRRYALVKLGVGFCGELSTFAKYVFAKQNVPCVTIKMIKNNDYTSNHSFNLIGSSENWYDGYFQLNQGKDINMLLEQLPGMYIVDPLLRSYGPTINFRTSPTASYLGNNNITQFFNDDSGIWNLEKLREIKHLGKELIELTRKGMNRKLDESYTQSVIEILQLQFNGKKWISRTKEPYEVWTHGTEQELTELKDKLADIGLSAEVRQIPGEGCSHTLVIREL